MCADMCVLTESLRTPVRWRWPSCAVPFVCGEIVLSPQCANLCSPGCTGQYQVHYSGNVWVLCVVAQRKMTCPQQEDALFSGMGRTTGITRQSTVQEMKHLADGGGKEGEDGES